MVAWMQYYNSENDDLLNSTEEWESEFNEDIFNNFEDDRIDVKYEVTEEEKASRNKRIKIIPESRFVCRTTQIWMGLHLHGLV